MSTPIHDPQRLLLAYIARVEQSGLCGYPALETHLHQHAMALKEQAALEAREARAAAATQVSERAGRPDQGQQPIAPSTPQCSEAARAESREGARPAPMAPWLPLAGSLWRCRWSRCQPTPASASAAA